MAKILSRAQRSRCQIRRWQPDLYIDAQVRRIDNSDRVALREGSDPEGYRRYTLNTPLFHPAPAEVLHLDTTKTRPADNAYRVLVELRSKGYVGTQTTPAP